MRGTGERLPRILRAGATLVAGLFMAAGLVGCTSSPCLPEGMTAAPGRVAPGGSFTLSASAAKCAAENPVPGLTYVATLRADSVRESNELARFTPGSNLGFSETLTVPSDFPIGMASVSVAGSPLDSCDDPAADCASYQTRIEIWVG